MFQVLWTAKLNDGTVGKVLDENRNITLYEDYADGQTRSVSVPIDSVETKFSAHDGTASVIGQYQRATTTNQATEKNP
jgi:hypothetical protein